MLKAYAESFYRFGAALGALDIYFESLAFMAGPDKAEKGRAHVASILPNLRTHCAEMGLGFSLKTMGRLERLVTVEPPDVDELKRLIAELDERVREELGDRVLFFVTPNKVANYDNFRRGWEAALAKLPVAADVEEAEKCFALDRWTGCVFHLMRVVEIGVQAVGTHLTIPVAVTEPWGTVVREIQKAVQAMPHATPSEKDAQTAYAGIADALFQINLAWRIPAMHPRTPGQSYTEEQASDALGRVKAFMRILAETLP